MQTRYLIGGVVAAAALAVAAYSINTNTIEYTDIKYAVESGKRVQVKGVWVKEHGEEYDAAKNEFRFTMKDDNAKEILVTYHGAKPNNFELAESIVVKGKVEGNTMVADHILTKCPSKYQGSVEDLQQSSSM